MDAVAFVQLNPSDCDAPYKMAYAIREVASSAILLLENAVRSYLSALKIDEALRQGRGGYNIKDKLPPDDLDKIDRKLAEWGLVLHRIAIAAFDLEATALKARASVIVAEKGAEAAGFDKQKKAREAAGFLICSLAEVTGKSAGDIQAEINSDQKVKKQFVKLLQDAMLSTGFS